MKLKPNRIRPPERRPLTPEEALALSGQASRVGKMLMDGAALASAPDHFSAADCAFILASVIANLALAADETPGGDGEAFIAMVLQQLGANRRAFLEGRIEVRPIERFGQ